MAKQDIDVKGHTAADPQAVFRLLGDSTTWPSWTAIDTASIDEPGGPDGVGEVRTFRTGRYVIRERIAERVPDRRLTYVLLSGVPARDYRAEIDLTPGAGGGTDIRWHTTFTSKIPGLGGVIRKRLDKITREFVDGLAAHATTEGRV